MAVTTPTPTDVSPSGGEPSAARPTRPFLRWGLATYLVTTAVMVTAILVWLDGQLVYVLDDPGIHLSMADTLVHDRTWGVASGEFQSASSSPLWTALLAATLVLAGPAAEWMPLVLNVAAGVAAVWVLSRAPAALSPDRRRLDALATVVLVAVVLFLPGLAVVGMEHTLHVALVLAAVLVGDRWVNGDARTRPWVLFVVVGAATLTRFETAFVALGLAAALLLTLPTSTGRTDGTITSVPDTGPDPRARRFVAAGALAAAGLPIIAFGLVNKVLGGSWLPNSVLAKGQLTADESDSAFGPVDSIGRLTQDPLLAALFGLAVAYLVLRGVRGRAAAPAVVLVVATPLHAMLADVGWYERYQAYLLAVGVYFLLAAIAEVPTALRRRCLAVVCVLGILFGTVKISMLVRAPQGADDMYRQQYQAGLFLDRYYDGEPVATDQLGYISYFHDGPITDFAGLGDHEVLEASQGVRYSELWGDLAAERGFRVVVLYDVVAAFKVPDGWVQVAEWKIDGEPLTGVSDELLFFATRTDEIEPLQAHLRAFEADLPSRTHLVLNENAALQGMSIDAQADDGER